MLKCEICGKEFKNKRALGSHMHYVHKDKGEKGDREPIDLKEKLIEILRDFKVVRGANTIVDIFFELGGNDLRKLDELLRLNGVSAPIRKLVIERYAQIAGLEIPKNISEKEEDYEESEFLRVYDILAKRGLQDLLIEDLKMRIEERKS
ncbi:MAG: C2H2-type zinc finger protein [Archaeoglobaceae archaeon]